VQVRDDRADLAHGGVEILERLLDALLHQWIVRASQHALQLQAGREQPLDHAVGRSPSRGPSHRSPPLPVIDPSSPIIPGPAPAAIRSFGRNGALSGPPC
jgi:hypothetical protein